VSALDWLSLHAPDLVEAAPWIAAAAIFFTMVLVDHRSVPRG
jgi:hypothetical protein